MSTRMTSCQHFAMCILFVAMAIAFPRGAAQAASLQLYVDCSSSISPANGSRTRPFADISTAVDSGRARSPRYSSVTITVLPGSCAVDEPIRLDYPVTLRGSSVLNFDSGLRPTGIVVTGTETRILATAALGVNPVIIVEPVAYPSTVDNVVVSNLSVEGTAAVTATSGPVEAMRVRNARNVLLSDLVVTAPAGYELLSPSAGIDVASSSGQVTRSYVRGMGACAICVAGGTSESPTRIAVSYNRAVANGAGSLLLAGTGVTGGDSLFVSASDNTFADNTTGKQGFGIRVIAIGSPLLELPNVASLNVRLERNEIANNRYQLIVDAGFPPRNKGPVPATICADEDPYTTGMQIELIGNRLTATEVTQSRALVTTTRAQVWLANNNSVLWQYLHSSAIAIYDPDRSLLGSAPSTRFLYDVPENDPFTNNPTDGGVCASDWVNEPLANAVSYNGATVVGKNF